jgi:virulence-associated protein VagC
MKTIDVIESSSGQLVRLPDEFRFNVGQVTIQREGDAIVLRPAKPKTWPPGFFEQIHIADPAFKRPEQGSTPPAPSF